MNGLENGAAWEKIIVIIVPVSALVGANRREEFPEAGVISILEQAKLTLRHRAQGFMVSMTCLALQDYPDYDPLTEPVARTLGH